MSYRRILLAVCGTLTLAVPLMAATPPAAGAAPTYSFGPAKLIVDNAMAGLPADDHTQPAAVDPCAMRKPGGGVRIIFTSVGEILRSAVSKDGKTYTVDTSFVPPVVLGDDGLPRAYGHPTVVARPGGGYRMFVRGEGGVVRSAVSTTGRVWTTEPGVRLLAADFSLARITGPSVVRTGTRRWRMYFSSETTDSTSAVYSATSRDQLTWKADSRILIGPGAPKLTWSANHARALRQPDGSITLIYAVPSVPGKPGYVPGRASRIMYSTSRDGVTFTKQKDTRVGVHIPIDPDLKGDDPVLLPFGEGTVLLFFNVFWPPGGDQVHVARGKLVE